MVTDQEYVEPSESMKAFLSGYCCAGICWVCGARLKEKGATVCPGGAHKLPQDQCGDECCGEIGANSRALKHALSETPMQTVKCSTAGK